MDLIRNIKNEIYFDEIKIGHIEYRNGDKCFVSYATFEKHLFRNLNAWTVNLEVITIPELKLIVWKIIGAGKEFSIEVVKLLDVMGKYNMILSGFKGYKTDERQIAVPATICDSIYSEENNVNYGKSLKEFETMIKDPHFEYQKWESRKKGKLRNWSINQ